MEKEKKMVCVKLGIEDYRILEELEDIIAGKFAIMPSKSSIIRLAIRTLYKTFKR